MRIRRSWWRRPRWWVSALEPLALALFAGAFFAAREVHPGPWGSPGDSWWTALGGVVGGVLGATVGGVRDRYRRARRWEEFQAAALASDAEMDLAERVVRRGLAPADERTRGLALRMARKQQELTRTTEDVVVLAVVGVAFLLAGVLNSLWWLMWTLASAVGVASALVADRRLRRRQRELEALAV